MSLFSQDLDKGGVLRDVVSIYDICYPSGKPLDTSIISARDTTQLSYDDYNGCPSDLFFPNYQEFDNKNDGILTPQGFYCNQGFIEYKHLFTEEVLNDLMLVNSDLNLRSLLTNSILRGNIETLFIPFAASRIYTSQKPKDNRYIYDYQWWNLVETSIYDGLSKYIDPSWRYHIFVRKCGYNSSYLHLACSFYITIKLFGHHTYGDIFWPVEEDDQFGQLFRTMDPNWPSKIKQEVGSPISISTRVDMEYIGELDPKEQEEF